MTSTSDQPVVGRQANSLQSLLDAIDRKTAPALQLDLARLKERSVTDQRVRTLHISFVVGWHEMALPIHAMQEIGDMPVITPLPHLPPWIKGIVQIRGEILSVVDFQLLFNLREERRRFLKQSYILFKEGDLQFCLLAGRITGILNLDEQHDRLEECSLEEQSSCAAMLAFIKGVLVRDTRRIFVLDSQTLGAAEQIRQWRQA